MIPAVHVAKLLEEAGDPRMKPRFAATALLLLLAPGIATAGPPYTTDDPEPVEVQHVELYLGSVTARDGQGWSGTAPHLEVNYGALANLQLHVILPAAWSAQATQPARYGLGDLELGAKLRFVQEGERMPQIGIFPLVELPCGDETKGLGAGHVQVLLPLWLQKGFGPWTTYGGVGYWFSSDAAGHGSWFLGWQVQRRLSELFTVGAELFHTTPKDAGGEAETRFNLGLVVDLTDLHHLLWSAGRGLQGPNRFQAYLAYQLTFALPGSAPR